MKTAQPSLLEKARAVQSGDTVVIDFAGRVDGEAFEGGAAAEGHRLTIGLQTPLSQVLKTV